MNPDNSESCSADECLLCVGTQCAKSSVSSSTLIGAKMLPSESLRLSCSGVIVDGVPPPKVKDRMPGDCSAAEAVNWLSRGVTLEKPAAASRGAACRRDGMAPCKFALWLRLGKLCTTRPPLAGIKWDNRGVPERAEDGRDDGWRFDSCGMPSQASGSSCACRRCCCRVAEEEVRMSVVGEEPAQACLRPSAPTSFGVLPPEARREADTGLGGTANKLHLGVDSPNSCAVDPIVEERRRVGESTSRVALRLAECGTKSSRLHSSASGSSCAVDPIVEESRREGDATSRGSLRLAECGTKSSRLHFSSSGSPSRARPAEVGAPCGTKSSRFGAADFGATRGTKSSRSDSASAASCPARMAIAGATWGMKSSRLHSSASGVSSCGENAFAASGTSWTKLSSISGSTSRFFRPLAECGTKSSKSGGGPRLPEPFSVGMKCESRGVPPHSLAGEAGAAGATKNCDKCMSNSEWSSSSPLASALREGHSAAG
mmetsp:Transcript_5316/g.20020  ORF Transcript_5316/g.20020 Transcript_5316/m.20020 type:complete len:487 (-) Transcript_5316:505-1965(-)